MVAETCAIGLVLGCWAVLFVILSGLGAALRLPFRVEEPDTDDVFLCFWSGFAILLVFLQLWHLFQPVNWVAAIILGVSGIVGHVAARGVILKAVRRAWSRASRLFAACVLLAAVWVANRATAAPDFIDSGNYHFQVIRWVTSYPIVKGLGNIDGHLVFNNASLLYQGFLENGFLQHRSAHIGNGILLLIVFLFFLDKIREAWSQRKFTSQALFAHTLMTPLVFLTRDVSTPNTDLPSALMLFVIAYYLVGIASGDGPAVSIEGWGFRVVALSTLCAEALAVKLSASFYAGCGCVALLWMWLLTERATVPYRVKVAAVGVAIAAGGVTLWATRGVLLSGYPFFPSLALKFPVAWRIPQFYAEWNGWFIRTFARAPYSDDISADGFGWIRHWCTFDLRAAKLEGILPLLLAALGLSYLCMRSWRDGWRASPWRALLVWLPLAVSIPLWFASAPSLRFGTALLWILAAQAVAFALCNAPGSSSRLARLPVPLLCLLPASGILMQTWLSYQNHHGLVASLEAALWVAPGPDDGLHPVPVNAVETMVNADGVTWYRPANQFCAVGDWRDCVMWYGPVPSPMWQGAQAGTVVKERLRYLSPPDPSGGFAIQDTQEQWIMRHREDVRQMAHQGHMNLRQLTFHFQVGPEVIRSALR